MKTFESTNSSLDQRKSIQRSQLGTLCYKRAHDWFIFKQLGKKNDNNTPHSVDPKVGKVGGDETMRCKGAQTKHLGFVLGIQNPDWRTLTNEVAYGRGFLYFVVCWSLAIQRTGGGKGLGSNTITRLVVTLLPHLPFVS